MAGRWSAKLFCPAPFGVFFEDAFILIHRMEVHNIMNSKNNAEKKSHFCDKTQKSNMDYVRDQIHSYLAKNNMSVAALADKAGISVYTLNSILRYDIKTEDCKLSTAIALAKAIGIGVDELANTGALPDASLESVQIARSLPQQTIELIRRYIRWQQAKHEKFKNYRGKIIEVMDMDYEDDHLRTTNHFEKVDISEFDEDVKAIVFRGMRMPCNEYIQYYHEGDILLISASRQPRARERCMILYYNRIFIVQRDRKDGVNGYRGIRDEDAFIPESDIDYYFGYVVAVKHA